MSKQAFDTDGTPGPRLSAVSHGTVTEIAVAAGADFAFIEIGTAPTAETAGQRIRIPARVPEYFSIERGVEKVAAKAGITSNVMASPVSIDCTVIRVIYDDVAAVVEVMEAK